MATRGSVLWFTHRHTSPQYETEPIIQPSLDEWILGTLERGGSQGLEQLAAPLGQVNWSELFLAIDRLARAGDILMWPSASGEVVLALNSKFPGASDARAREFTSIR